MAEIPPKLPPVLPSPEISSPALVPAPSPAPRLSSFRVRVALAAAVMIDLLQIGLFPFFSPGIVSPLEDISDCAAFLFFWALVGWHFALLPSFVCKLIPFVDLAPTWTIAVALAIRSNQRKT